MASIRFRVSITVNCTGKIGLWLELEIGVNVGLNVRLMFSVVVRCG